MSIALTVFLIFVAMTLGVTYWAARRSRGASAYFAAGRRITAWQNGFAVAGDFMKTIFWLNGSLEFFDDQDNLLETLDVFWFIDHYLSYCREHRIEVNKKLFV